MLCGRRSDGRAMAAPRKDKGSVQGFALCEGSIRAVATVQRGAREDNAD